MLTWRHVYRTPLGPTPLSSYAKREYHATVIQSLAENHVSTLEKPSRSRCLIKLFSWIEFEGWATDNWSSAVTSKLYLTKGGEQLATTPPPLVTIIALIPLLTLSTSTESDCLTLSSIPPEPCSPHHPLVDLCVKTALSSVSPLSFPR
jgi:hypothetical protein